MSCRPLNMEKSVNMQYSDFASIYDRLMDDFDYAAWAGHYLELIQKMGGTPRQVGECGCGTGSLSVELVRRGVRLTAGDLSEEMLRLAGEKARKNGLMIPFVRQDMRRLSYHRPMDAIIAACDAVNYLLSVADLDAFFGAAHQNLKPGGVLAFDISSPYKLMELTGDGFFGEEREDVAYLWQNRADREKRLITMDLSFFVQERGDLYRKFRETHVQRAHTRREIIEALERAGFEDCAVFGEFGFDPPEEKALRLHFAARKKG